MVEIIDISVGTIIAGLCSLVSIFNVQSNDSVHLIACSLLPLYSNVSHSRVFRADYGCVEKTLLPLFFKHWECAN